MLIRFSQWSHIRFSKTLSKYQEQLYPREKTIIAFLDPPKKKCSIRGMFMEQPGNIPIFNIPGTLFWNIPRNFIGDFFRIYWEYLKGMLHKYILTYIYPVGNGLVKKVTTLVKSSMFDVWHGSISLRFLKNLKLNRQHKHWMPT